MSWTTTTDLAAFLAAAGEMLRAQPAENTILLTTAETLKVGGVQAYGSGEPWYGWWSGPDGRVGAAFLQTPPFPLVLAAGPERSLKSLVEIAGDVDRINAEQGAAQLLAAHWQRRRGTEIEVHQHLRLYRLAALTPPDPAPPGRARLATTADRDRLTAWYAAFEEEVGEPSNDPGRAIDERMGYDGLMVWEVDGVPVSMAGRTRPAAGMLRVGPVFTPTDLRGRGYAGAVTAAVSRAAQDLVDEVLLFTDMANPTSNSIYQRLGYRPVADRLVIAAGSPVR